MSQRRSVLLSDSTFYRLKQLKKVYKINISDSIEFLAEEHLSTLENRMAKKEQYKAELRVAIETLCQEILEKINKL